MIFNIRPTHARCHGRDNVGNSQCRSHYTVQYPHVSQRHTNLECLLTARGGTKRAIRKQRHCGCSVGELEGKGLMITLPRLWTYILITSCTPPRLEANTSPDTSCSTMNTLVACCKTQTSTHVRGGLHLIGNDMYFRFVKFDARGRIFHFHSLC